MTNTPSLSDILQDLYNIGRHEEAGGLTDRKVALEEAEAAINQYIEDAYERGYKHGHNIGYEEGKSGYQPEPNIKPEVQEVKDE